MNKAFDEWRQRYQGEAGYHQEDVSWANLRAGISIGSFERERIIGQCTILLCLVLMNNGMSLNT